MKIVVVSNPKAIVNEIETVRNLFKSGLEVFHLRKPGYSKKQYEAYLKRIPSKYWSRIVIHDHYFLAVKYGLRGIHLSGRTNPNSLQIKAKLKFLRFLNPALKISATNHSLESFKNYWKRYEYVFLSPVFDAMDSQIKSPFSVDDLRLIASNPDYKVIAMGGIQENRISEVQNLGFNGVALVSSLWKSTDPVGVFSNFKMNAEAQHRLVS